MQRKIVERDDRGRLVERWVDLGPGSARRMSGAPIAVAVNTSENVALTGGRRQPIARAL